MHAAPDRRCMSHTTAPDVALKLQEARSRGGRTTGRKRQEERAERSQQRDDMGTRPAVGVFLGRIARQARLNGDAALLAAGAKAAEVALRLLDDGELERENRQLRDAVTRLKERGK